MRRSIAALVLALAIFPLAGQTLTLRLAAYVPANSSWDIGLKKLAAEFERISAGRVRLAFPQSLKGASESDIIQKLRLGLDGALLTSSGLAELYPDSLAVSMPTVVTDDGELNAVIEAIEPLLADKLSDRYVVLALTKAGWIRYFSKTPVVTPDDLSKLRVSVPLGDDTIQRLFQSLGCRTVRGDFSALFLQLSSNAVDVFYTSPIFVSGLWSQFKGKVSYISPFRASPYLGALVFSRQSWERVPAALRPKLEEAARNIAREMSAEGERMEAEAVNELLRAGILMPPYPPEAEKAWREVYAERRRGLIGELFSSEMLSTIDAALARARSGR